MDLVRVRVRVLCDEVVLDDLVNRGVRDGEERGAEGGDRGCPVTEAVQRQRRLQCHVWQRHKWRSHHEAHKTLQFAPHKMAPQHLQKTGASQ